MAEERGAPVGSPAPRVPALTASLHSRGGLSPSPSQPMDLNPICAVTSRSEASEKFNQARNALLSWAAPVGFRGAGRGISGSSSDPRELGVISPCVSLLTSLLPFAPFPHWPLSRLAASLGILASPFPFW